MSPVKRGKFTERKLDISLNAEFQTNKCDASCHIFRPLHRWSPESVNYKGPFWHGSADLQLQICIESAYKLMIPKPQDVRPLWVQTLSELHAEISGCNTPRAKLTQPIGLSAPNVTQPVCQEQTD